MLLKGILTLTIVILKTRNVSSHIFDFRLTQATFCKSYVSVYERMCACFYFIHFIFILVDYSKPVFSSFLLESNVPAGIYSHISTPHAHIDNIKFHKHIV